MAQVGGRVLMVEFLFNFPGAKSSQPFHVYYKVSHVVSGLDGDCSQQQEKSDMFQPYSFIVYIDVINLSPKLEQG